MNTQHKLQRLQALLADTGSCVVAFSGGVDSTFLTKVAYDTLGNKALAVTMVTPFFPTCEYRAVRRLATHIGVRHIFLKAALPRTVRPNPADRCYHCKKHAFGIFCVLARQKGFQAVVEGSNSDDENDYRPGMRAIRELGVRSPLREVGLAKREIRVLSRRVGLETWDKPSAACLGSRFPYGEKFTPKKLKMVERAEEYLRAKGIRQVRVRFHDNLARVEADFQGRRFLLKHAGEIAAALRGLGFTYVSVDIEGYRSGAMNETIGWKPKKSQSS